MGSLLPLCKPPSKFLCAHITPYCNCNAWLSLPTMVMLCGKRFCGILITIFTYPKFSEAKFTWEKNTCPVKHSSDLRSPNFTLEEYSGLLLIVN
jgi:hypothetical protein